MDSFHYLFIYFRVLYKKHKSVKIQIIKGFNSVTKD